jgi:hypothetical protein
MGQEPEEPPKDPRVPKEERSRLEYEFEREMKRRSDPVRFLGDHIGHRTVSRIVEICGERILPLFGQDKRLQGWSEEVHTRDDSSGPPQLSAA